MTTRENTPANGAWAANKIANDRGVTMQLDDRARALLGALNELFTVDWACTPGSEFYAYTLKLPALDGHPFVYHRAIRPAHINGEPFRTALVIADEVCERYGRYMLLKPDVAQS